MNRKRSIWILLALAGVLGLVGTCASVAYLLTFGDHESLTTNTDSTQLKTSAERVAFLGRYLTLRTRASDAAFHIVYHDNSGGLPGPSDWSIVAAVRVTPADGPTWLAGATPLAPNDPIRAALPSPDSRLIPPEWQVSSAGVAYARDRALVVWHPEGVLEFAASTD